MALRQPTQKTQIVDLLFSDEQTINPFATEPSQGDLENFIPYYKKLVRQQPMPTNHTSIQASSVWHVFDFRYVDLSNVSHQKLLIFKSNGGVYDATSGTEVDVSPSPKFNAKPGIASINNRLHVSDGSQYLIYDGTSWVVAGLARPATGTVTLSGTGLTGQFITAITWVVEDGAGNRIHESSRSDLTTSNPSNQGIKTDISALTPPTRATHWSVYMSEVASSAVLRRIATLPIATITLTATAVAPSTAPQAPYRNDPPPNTKVLGQWKNRLAARLEQKPSNFWFSAFGEVAANNNGAAEESWPGNITNANAQYNSYVSISDLTNEWTLPDKGEIVQSVCWFDDFLFVFSNRNGYAIQGDGSLLDGRSLRDLYPNRVFTFGAASPFSTVATPHGIITLTPDRRLWLWKGSGDPINIGIDIQTRLNAISSNDLAAIQLNYWEANNRTWLVLPLSDRIQMFDFSLRTRNTGAVQASPYMISLNQGIWFSIGTQSALPKITATGIYNPTATNIPVLLAGGTDGNTYQIDGINQTTGTSPTAIARTASIEPTDGAWSEMKYVELFTIGTNDTPATGIQTANPTVTVYYDGISPTNPANGVAIPLRKVPQTNELRGWLMPRTASSGTGAMARRVQIELKFTDSGTKVAGVLDNNEIWELALAHAPKKELRL